jgi:signal transduction histidine kinase
VDEQIASSRLRVWALAAAAVYLGALLLLTPAAGLSLKPAPAFVAIYCAALITTESATAFLLFGAVRVGGSPSLLVLGCAYLFSAAMAALQVLMVPGAILRDEALLGDGSAAKSLFLLWQVGFPIMVAAAVLLRLSGARPMLAPRRAVTVASALTAAGCLLSFLILTRSAAGLAPSALATTRFSDGELLVSWVAVGLHLAAIAVACAPSRLRTSFDIWLMLALVGFTGEVFLGTVSGARFTLGWYLGLVSGMAAGCTLFGLFLARFAQQNRILATALAGAEERAFALQAEVRLREQAEYHLLQAQKMEALGQLTSGVAHDFTNLLQIVAGQLHLLADRLTEPRQHRYVTAIESALSRAGALTQHLHAFSRRRAPAPRIVDLAQELPRLVELLRPSLRGDIELHWEVAPDIWAVEVDPVEMDLAVLNVSLNARDAMPAGGRLTILAGNMRLAPDAVPGLPGGPYVTIAMADTGVGMPTDVAARVFEPFFTTKPATRGTGLGLSQVYSFARQHGGTALVESEPGRGTTVTVHLPPAVQKPEMLPSAVPTFESAPIAGLKILVVEDNDPVADVVRSMLEAFGCITVRAATAQEAIDMLEESRVFPSLMLSDIVMPGGMNGLELARIARDRWPSLSVLLTTGYSAAAQQAMTEDFTILSKPYRSNDLQRAVSRALQGVGLGVR